MSHLNIETLARLVDESADSHEAAHLEDCDECRSELEGLKVDAAALAQLPEIQPPERQWRAIQQRLIAEGLLRAPTTIHAERRWLTPVLQLAAALAIFVLGNFTAPLLRGANEAPVAVNRLDSRETDRGMVSSVATTTVSITDALATVRATEQAYLTALTRYAEIAGGTASADPIARLAALQSIVVTTGAALGQAPADPVINGYHLTAVAQRDATLKKLQTSAGQNWF
jgi:hypothetical protein